MSKEKFDLTNVGGQPKTWAEKNREGAAEDGRQVASLLGMILLGVVSAGLLLWVLFTLLF